MAKTKSKKNKIRYDSDNPQDMADLRLVKAAGWPTDQRYPRDKLNALASIPVEQIKKGGVHFVTHRKKLEGSEEREVEAVTIKRSTLPKCLHWLPTPLHQALMDYQSLYEACQSDGASNLIPRMDGGGMSSDNYDEDKMAAWGRARRQMSRKEAKKIDWAIRLSDDALIRIAVGH